MSNPSDKQDASPWLWSVVAGIVFIALFAIILNVAYLPTRKNVNTARAQERKQALLQHEAEQHKLATTYGWVNQDEGVVRLPIERAMELIVAEKEEGR